VGDLTGGPKLMDKHVRPTWRWHWTNPHRKIWREFFGGKRLTGANADRAVLQEGDVTHWKKPTSIACLDDWRKKRTFPTRFFTALLAAKKLLPLTRH